MKKEKLLKEIEDLISELMNLLVLTKKYAIDKSEDNLQKGNNSFEIIKEKYFKNIKKYLGKKYFGDVRRQRFNNLLKWTNISGGIWEGYITDPIEILKQFKYELEGMTKNEYSKFVALDTNNYWKILNPIYWFLELLKLGWNHKIISGIIIFLIGIIFTIIITDSIKPLTDIITKPISDTLSGSLNK